jgi:hypothetical protein
VQFDASHFAVIVSTSTRESSESDSGQWEPRLGADEACVDERTQQIRDDRDDQPPFHLRAAR